jgi:hypothetical protein
MSSLEALRKRAERNCSPPGTFCQAATVPGMASIFMPMLRFKVFGV